MNQASDKTDLDKLLAPLNENQRIAILDNSPALLVNARVGSGKTRTLISKIIYLHVAEKIDFHEMVVLTFTNKAANEIKNRILSIYPEVNEDNDLLYFGTFHSFARRLLSTTLPVETIGYERNFTIIEPEELEILAQRIIYENCLQIKFTNKLPQRLETYHAGRVKYANMKNEDDFILLVKLLSAEKIKQNVMDFDDLIVNATRLIKNYDFFPRWIIVDEFQDCDRNQIQMIEAMSSPRTKIFAVGDPNQIIYSWRGSQFNLFSEFKHKFDAKEISLPINYRSSLTILEAAKCFLKNGESLQGIREQGSKIKVKSHYSPFIEAQYLSREILELNKMGTKYSEIAVVYRLQKQSSVIEDTFSRANIPFEVSLRKTLRQIPALYWFVQILKAATNTNDLHSLIQILINGQFGENLVLLSANQIITSPDNSISGILVKKIRQFTSWSIQNSTPESVFNLYDYFDLDNHFSPTSIDYQKSRELIKNFLSQIYIYTITKQLDLIDGLKEFIASSSLYGTNILQDDIHLDQDSVKLLTLHACKGLEFTKVYIIGVNDGNIPLKVNNPKEQEEEKRLFFVGITRAKDNLEISYYINPDDVRVSPIPSPFISMLPSHLVEGEINGTKEVDLQTLRRDIKSRIVEQDKNIFDESILNIQETLNSIPKFDQKVYHDKYGEGYVEIEDDNTITVVFNSYGRKSFVKSLSQLKYLD